MTHSRLVIRGLMAAAISALLAVSVAPVFGQSDSDTQFEDIDPNLLAPADAESYDAQFGETYTAPTSGGEMALPYEHVLPLPEGPVGDPERTYKFCFSQALTGSTWAVAQLDSALIEAARHPNVELIAYNTNNDPLKQVQDLDTCVAQGVDAIVVWPHSVAPLTPAIERIVAAGTPVVGMERTIASDNYSTWIYLDNAKATADVAQAVCDALGGEGVVAETDGATGSSPQILRRVGFVNALAALCPDVTVEFTAPTDYSRGQGYKVALDYLQSKGDNPPDAWYDQYTEIGFGINQAIEDYGLTDQIPHFSIVDGKVATQAVLDGIFAGVAPWSPVHGDLGLRAAIYHVTGMEVPKALSLVQPPLITPENAADVLEQTWPG